MLRCEALSGRGLACGTSCQIIPTQSKSVPFQKYSGYFRSCSGLPCVPEVSWNPMTTKRSALLAIGVGGLAAGTLDLTQACILFGWKIPLSIAGGLLGPPAFHGGPAIYALGVVLHYFIACSFAAFYYASSRK